MDPGYHPERVGSGFDRLVPALFGRLDLADLVPAWFDQLDPGQLEQLLGSELGHHPVWVGFEPDQHVLAGSGRFVPSGSELGHHHPERVRFGLFEFVVPRQPLQGGSHDDG